MTQALMSISYNSTMPLPVCGTLLFISLTLLLVFTQGLHGVFVCPNCGNLTVPYPFSTSSSCGHPLYPINCSPHKTLQLDALSGTYTIKTVDASTRTFIIATASFVGDSCITEDAVSPGSFSLNTSRPFFISPNNTVFLFNASSVLSASPILQCAGASPCTEALTVFAQKSCRTLFCCSFSTSAGASTVFRYSFKFPSHAMGYSSVVNLINTTQPTSWNYGLQLGWDKPQEPPCTDPSQCGGNSTCSSRSNGLGKLCLCNSGYEWDSATGTCPKAPYCVRRRRSVACNKAAYAEGLILGFGGLIALSTCTVYMYRRYQAVQRAHAKLVQERSAILAGNSGGGKSAHLFSSQVMKRATNNFARDRILGCGGFGQVYKGVLNDGTVVAVKSAKVGNTKGTDQVLNEVRILTQVNHRNLVKLLGCCVESELPLMVYEYVPNGNLCDHLNGTKESFLDWETRLRIALQSAEGLAYLHSAADPPIYHRDVKSSNILLDQSMNAKVADFGLSRLAHPDLSHVSTCAQGTIGYLDPEYYRNYQLTDKSDVYSFGVVLLELVTSKSAVDFGRDEDDINLAVMVQGRADDDDGNMLDDVLDSKLTDGASMAALDSMRSIIRLALDCVQENRPYRPSMKEVAEKLQKIISTLETAEQGHRGNKSCG